MRVVKGGLSIVDELLVPLLYPPQGPWTCHVLDAWQQLAYGVLFAALVGARRVRLWSGSGL